MTNPPDAQHTGEEGGLCHRSPGIKVLPCASGLVGSKAPWHRGWGKLECLCKSHLAGDTAKATQLHRKKDGMDILQPHGALP